MIWLPKNQVLLENPPQLETSVVGVFTEWKLRILIVFVMTLDMGKIHVKIQLHIWLNIAQVGSNFLYMQSQELQDHGNHKNMYHH